MLTTTKRAGMGSAVVIVFADGRKADFKIEDSTLTDPDRGIISYQSPLGNALLGKCAGEKGSYAVGEKIIAFEVLAIIDSSTLKSK